MIYFRCDDPWITMRHICLSLLFLLSALMCFAHTADTGNGDNPVPPFAGPAETAASSVRQVLVEAKIPLWDGSSRIIMVTEEGELHAYTDAAVLIHGEHPDIRVGRLTKRQVDFLKSEVSRVRDFISGSIFQEDISDDTGILKIPGAGMGAPTLEARILHALLTFSYQVPSYNGEDLIEELIPDENSKE